MYADLAFNHLLLGFSFSVTYIALYIPNIALPFTYPSARLNGTLKLDANTLTGIIKNATINIKIKIILVIFSFFKDLTSFPQKFQTTLFIK